MKKMKIRVRLLGEMIKKSILSFKRIIFEIRFEAFYRDWFPYKWGTGGMPTLRQRQHINTGIDFRNRKIREFKELLSIM